MQCILKGTLIQPMRKVYILLYTLLMLSACREDLTDQPVMSEAEWMLPLVYGSFQLGDLLNELGNDSLFSNTPEGELLLSYRNDPLFSFNFSQFYKQKTVHFSINATEILGPVGLDIQAHQQYINLQEIIIRLSFIPEISTIPEGKAENFAGISTDSLLAPFLLWPVDGFDAFTSATFETGHLLVKVRNEFPVAMQATLVFIDSALNILGEVKPGMQNPHGLLPTESDSAMIDLAGKSMTGPLYFYIKNSRFFPSDTSIFLRFSEGFEMDVVPKMLRVNKGHFKPDAFQLQHNAKSMELAPYEALQLTKAGIQSGTLRVQLAKSFEPDLRAHFKFPGIIRNGEPLEVELSFNGSAPLEAGIDLSGLNISLSHAAHVYNTLEYQLAFSNPGNESVFFQGTDQYSYSLVIENLHIESMEGNLGRQTHRYEKTSAPLHTELWKILGKNAINSGAKLNILFNNPTGIPAYTQFNIRAASPGGQAETLTSGKFNLNYPTRAGDPAEATELNFTAENSNLLKFLSLPPDDSLRFQMEFNTNPEELQNPAPNHLNFNDSVTIGLQLQLPLKVADSLFFYSDTLAFLSMNIPDTRARVNLICRSRNEMPLDALLEMTPFDTLQNSATGTTWRLNLLEAVAASDLPDANERVNHLELHAEQMQALSKANALLIRVSFSNANDTNHAVVLRHDMGFELKMWLNIHSHAAH